MAGYLEEADECWIAVALLSHSGYEFLQGLLPADCSRHYLVGTWLPTDAGVLKDLLDRGLRARIFTHSGFHPKLYLLRKRNKYTAFLGSSNATGSGLFHNVELNVMLDDQAACKELLRWFEATALEGKPITERFLKNYKPLVQRRRDETEVIDDEQQELQKILDDNAALVQALRKLRKQTRRYNKLKATRQEDLDMLRTSLDFPRFKKLDLDSFFPNRSLGTIFGFHQPKIRNNQADFQRLLQFLYRRRNTVIAATVDAALGPDYKMEGIGPGLVTKLLTTIDPDRFCTWNSRSGEILSQLGYESIRGTFGQKYERMCTVLKTVAAECDVEDLAVLDLCLLYVEEDMA